MIGANDRVRVIVDGWKGGSDGGHGPIADIAEMLRALGPTNSDFFSSQYQLE
jgi:hypothetical protein